MKSLSQSCFKVTFANVLVAAAALMTAGVLVGFLLGKSQVASQPRLELPHWLHADSAARGKGLSLSTGQVDTNVEGLFVLDHLTGRLECWVLNTRNGKVAARYQANVFSELENQKTGSSDFVLVTGRFVFEGGVQGNQRPGRCICYVADGDSGKVIGYGMRFNRQVMLQGDQQTGDLFVVCRGNMRDAQRVRDQ